MGVSKRWILALLAVILTLVDIYSIPNITVITADIDTSVSAVTSQIQQPTRREEEEEEEADAREVVTTRPYNNTKVAYITFGSFNQGPARFQNLVLDALRTWLKGNVIFYVLNTEWKTKFEDACNQPSNRQECKRVVPMLVDCPEGYSGESPCCKMDKGMAAMWKTYPHYDWYSYQDDDMYIRTSYMDEFLSGLSPNESMVLTCTRIRQLGVTWDKKFNSNCSRDIDYMYPWGQPAMYSRAGLERMSKAFEMGAITKQCKAYGVTHDAGNPIVHWMLSLPEVHFPPIPSWSLRVQFHEMGTHAVGRRGTPNTTAVHAQIAHVKYPQPPYQYKWHKPNGFFKTATYKLYGNVSEWTEWHTMPVSDCRGPNGTMSSGSSDITSSRNQNIRKATKRRPKRAKQHLNNQLKPLHG